MRQIRTVGIILILACVSEMVTAQDIVPRNIIDLLDCSHLQYDRAVAREAYKLLSPLVLAYEDIYSTCVDSSSGDYAGGFGAWTFENSGNGTRMVGRTWLDLDECSWRISFARDIHLKIILADPWGRERQITSTDSWMIIWDSRKPKPVDNNGIIAADSRFIEIRVLTTEEASNQDIDTKETIKALHLDQVPNNVTHKVASSSWPLWRKVDMPSSGCFAFANFMLQYVPLDSVAPRTLSRIARIGIGPGKSWPPKGVRADFIEAMDTGVDQARVSNGTR